jgi:hypothetical protein
MAKRTQIVCLHEGERGRSIDPVFINRLLRTLRPAWIRPFGTSVVRLVDGGGRTSLMQRLPAELRACVAAGGDTTLMVWADMDHDCADGEALRRLFWEEAERQGITREDFDRVVFVLAKDRLENWVEFLTTGSTDEVVEGPRVRDAEAVQAASALAALCQRTPKASATALPPSLRWSCRNWQRLVERMKAG